MRCLWLVLFVIISACRAPEGRDYAEPAVSANDRFLAGSNQAAAEQPLAAWWREFDNPELNATIDRVLDSSNDLAAAAARVEQAAAEARIAGAAGLPTVNATSGGTRQRQNFVGLPIPGTSGVLSSTATTLGLSLDVSWEPDLWGKIDAARRGATALVHASVADERGVRLSLVGQTVKSWLAHAATRLQLDVAERRVSNYSQTSRLLAARYADGRLDPLEFRLSESQLAAARAARDAQREILERMKRQLEVLQGDYPAGIFEGPSELPELPGEVPLGLPSELLQRRPDLAAAIERMRSADLRLYEARKALWPSLSLTGSGGRRSEELSDLAKNSFAVWSLAGNVFQPLFQGGLLRAGVDLAAARVSDSLANYRQMTLVAFSEVETALAAAEHLNARIVDLAESARHALAGESLAEARYRSGRYDILSVLAARRQSFDAENSLIEARRVRLEARVDLYLALGGGFTLEEVATHQDQITPEVTQR